MRKTFTLALTLSPLLFGCGGGGGGGGSSTTSAPTPEPVQAVVSNNNTSVTSKQDYQNTLGTVIGFSSASLLYDPNTFQYISPLSPSSQLELSSKTDSKEFSLKRTSKSWVSSLSLHQGSLPGTQGEYLGFKTSHALHLSLGDFELVPKLTASNYSLDFSRLPSLQLTAAQAQLELKTSFIWNFVTLTPEALLFLTSISSYQGRPQESESGFAFKVRFQKDEYAHSAFSFSQKMGTWGEQTQLMFEISASF